LTQSWTDCLAEFSGSIVFGTTHYSIVCTRERVIMAILEIRVEVPDDDDYTDIDPIEVAESIAAWYGAEILDAEWKSEK
jgi:hypothetical protein